MMSDGGSVLPQAEIDALFKQATGKSIVPPPVDEASSSGAAPSPPISPAAPSAKPSQEAAPAAPVSSPPPPVQPAAPAPSDELLKTIQATLDDLAQRMTKVETNISRLSQQEGGSPDVSASVQRLSQRLETVVRNLQKVNSQVDGVSKGLEGTPGYNIRSDFTCKSCGSHGFIALPMKCTQCGEEGWWGWWPKEK